MELLHFSWEWCNSSSQPAKTTFSSRTSSWREMEGSSSMDFARTGLALLFCPGLKTTFSSRMGSWCEIWGSSGMDFARTGLAHLFLRNVSNLYSLNTPKPPSGSLHAMQNRQKILKKYSLDYFQIILWVFFTSNREPKGGGRRPPLYLRWQILKK